MKVPKHLFQPQVGGARAGQLHEAQEVVADQAADAQPRLQAALHGAHEPRVAGVQELVHEAAHARQHPQLQVAPGPRRGSRRGLALTNNPCHLKPIAMVMDSWPWIEHCMGFDLP